MERPVSDGTLRRQHRFTVLPEPLIRDRRISDRAMRVWCLLDRYAGANGQAFPKRKTLATALGCSVATLDRAIEELVQFGWLSKERREAGGVNDYTLMDGSEGVLMGEDTPTHEDTPSSRVTTPLLTGDETQKEASPRETDGSENSDSLRSSSSKRGARLPDGWQPDEPMRDWFRQQPFATTINPVMETEKFIDYWRAQPGQRGVKLDWAGTWRNWMRNAAQRATGGSRAPQHPTVPAEHRQHADSQF
jgi:DNA-binding transcriptional MocR family regulator